MAVEHPLSGVVENTDDVATFASSDQCRVAQITERSVGADLNEMMPVKVHAMRERRVVHHRYARCFATLKGPERLCLQIRYVVERPDVVTAVASCHSPAHHRQCQVLRRLAWARQVIRRKRPDRTGLPDRIGPFDLEPSLPALRKCLEPARPARVPYAARRNQRSDAYQTSARQGCCAR